jgi:hypothetical protein
MKKVYFSALLYLLFLSCSTLKQAAYTNDNIESTLYPDGGREYVTLLINNNSDSDIYLNLENSYYNDGKNASTFTLNEDAFVLGRSVLRPIVIPSRKNKKIETVAVNYIDI